MMKYLLPLLTLFVASSASADIKVGTPAENFTGQTATGKVIHISDYKEKTIVLEWTNPGCPFVKKFYGSGTMQKLQAEATKKGVIWLSINSSAKGKEGNMDAASARAWLKEQKAVPTEYVLDADGVIGHKYGAKTTPHMFVIDKGWVIYAGAIDDKPTPNAKDIKGATNYVMAAIDAAKAGKKPKVASTQAYGCNVKY